MSQNQWPQCVLFSSPWYIYLLLSVRMCSILITSVSPPGGQPSTNCSSSGEPMPIARTWQGRPNHCQRETKVEVDVWFMHNSIVNVAVDSPADRGVSGWFSSQKLECWCTLSPGCVDTSWGGGVCVAVPDRNHSVTYFELTTKFDMLQHWTSAKGGAKSA